MRMNETETASIQSIRRAEIFTSRQAIQMETAVTRTARNTAEAAVARGVAQQEDLRNDRTRR